ncbi:MAG: putative toxin-antitoxin system toxin component, PIN family [Deltaproteobacteria bacterium]|nr:putative toxin-antitoxin system toxin component, PIN family [Deltaproteobacteria bacterium]
MPVRAVIDTNVVLSGLLSKKGHPHLILDAWIQQKFHPILSPPLFEEYLRTLRYKKILKRLGNSLPWAEGILYFLLDRAETVYPKQSIELFADPYDDMLIEAALTGRARYIVNSQESSFGSIRKKRYISGAAGDFQLEKRAALRMGLTVSNRNDQRFDIDDASAAAFTEWIRSLDKMFRARILIKVDRLAQGTTTNV